MEDFEAVYRTYFHKVYLFILSLSHDPALAEDITQETFFKALRAIDTFDGRSNVYTWLCKIAKNLYFDHHRKHKPPRADSEALEALAVPSFEEALLSEESAQHLRRMIHGLPEPYKEVVMLRVYGGMSHGQIGALFEKGESWARVTFYRGKMMLISNLEEDLSC